MGRRTTEPRPAAGRASPSAGPFRRLWEADGGGDPFEGVSVRIHRNGESEACAVREASSGSALEAFERAFAEFEYLPPMSMDHHDADSFLTRAFSRRFVPFDACNPVTYDRRWPAPEADPGLPGLLNFCDMGEDRTPILPDHGRLVRVEWAEDEGGDDASRRSSLPCHFHTRDGVRVASVEHLAHVARNLPEEDGRADEEEDGRGCDGPSEACPSPYPLPPRKTLDLYAVPAGRQFLFAPSYVGETIELPHVSAPSGLPVRLVTVSLSPRVLDVVNFYSEKESAEVVQRALAETSESHRIKRSSTGASGYNVNSQRTSENGFDTSGRVAMALKRRCFEVLGFNEYTESFADGLQVLRYNKTTAYVPHLDWIDDYQKMQPHDYDSVHKGTNRFATMLLYMSDLPDDGGGETVFSKGWGHDTPVDRRVELPQALQDVRKSSEVAALFRRGSWEEKMVAQCRTRLNVRPHSSRSVLFYSQHPDGSPDESSLHGGCPVLAGEKWAANLWVWNGPRDGYPDHPVNRKFSDRQRQELERKQNEDAPGGLKQISAVFTNRKRSLDTKRAKLYFQETFWADFGWTDPPIRVNTYEGHVWNVYVDDKIVETYTVGNDRKQQFYL